MTPSAYRNGVAGLAIRYGVAACTLGWPVVAASERGVCAIEFGDGPAELPPRPRERFPGARAVAGACAANALAVAVRCHRVVRADGQLSGYRWGVERKRARRQRERLPGSLRATPEEEPA